MDKIEGIRNRLNVQKVQNDWFDFKKIQAEEQVKLITTVQANKAEIRAELRKPEQQTSFQNSRNPLQDVVDDALSGFQKLLEFSAINDSSTIPVQTHLDLDMIVTSMKNQFQLQTFTGKEFETLLSLLKQNPNNVLMKNAIADVLRAFSAIQLANEAQNSIDKAVDDLIVLLKNDVTFQLEKKGTLHDNADEKLLNLLFKPSSIQNQQNRYKTTFPNLKEMLQQIQHSFPDESSISKTIGRIFSAMKRIDDAQNFDLKSAVEKLMNLTGNPVNESTDKLSLLFQKFMGSGGEEEKSESINGAQNVHSSDLAQKLIEKAKLTPEKNELENAFLVINQLKKQYPQSQAVQTFSTQTLNGLTANLLANQPMLHFFLKSFLNDSPHIADVWIDPDHEEDGGKTVKVMLSVDLENSDRFEVELKLSGKLLYANVYCPEAYVKEMQGIKKVIREQANNLGYSVPNLNIGVLSEKKSLEDIFGKDRSGRRSFHARV